MDGQADMIGCICFLSMLCMVYGEEIGSLYITINTKSLDLAWSNSLLNSKDNLDFVSKTSD